MIFEEHYSTLQNEVNAYLAKIDMPSSPESVYAPIRYVMEGGGKRVRPVLVLLASQALGGDSRNALPIAAAIEVLHNFTLVHDDIMDSASLRRGRATVHTRWDTNIAILAGDTMMGVMLRQLTALAEHRRFSEIVNLFTDGLIEVCEGQALDLELEQKDIVTPDEYILMIQKKTSSLLKVAACGGALAADAPPESVRAMLDFAVALGTAFQIQDDLLDLTADSSLLGKVSGGDIVEGKRTFLIVEAMQRCRGADAALLQEFLESGGLPAERVPEMKSMLRRNAIFDIAEEQVAHYTEKSRSAIAHFSLQKPLIDFANLLVHRTF